MKLSRLITYKHLGVNNFAVYYNHTGDETVYTSDNTAELGIAVYEYILLALKK